MTLCGPLASLPAAPTLTSDEHELVVMPHSPLPCCRVRLSFWPARCAREENGPRTRLPRSGLYRSVGDFIVATNFVRTPADQNNRSASDGANVDWE